MLIKAPIHIRLSLNYESDHDFICANVFCFQDIARINLDKVLDSDGKSELHLGKIADAMIEWEGKIAEHLCLTPADINDVKAAHPMRLDLQKYVTASCIDQIIPNRRL